MIQFITQIFHDLYILTTSELKINKNKITKHCQQIFEKQIKTFYPGALILLILKLTGENKIPYQVSAEENKCCQISKRN